MSCMALPNLFSRISNSCLHSFRLKRKPQPLNISAPFNLQEGPAVNLQDLGYSEEEFDLDLLREKAIASTAIAAAEDSDSDFYALSPYAVKAHSAQSRNSLNTCGQACGLGCRAVYQRRRSRAYM